VDVFLRSIVVFVLLWVVLRVVGKRQVAQLNAFDMILLITMGDLVSQGVVQEDYSLTSAAIAVLTFGLFGTALSWVSFRQPKVRTYLDGQPRLVIRNGAVLTDVLTSERLTLDDLREAARENGIRDLGAVEACVLEPDGTFSFL
jgi:uncharacterized membrane protein YcaP (DUF421 family)